jgi:hypothetical protein
MKSVAGIIMAAMLCCAFASPDIFPRAGDVPVLFRVKQNGKMGYIDRSGKMVIPPQFQDAGLFQEGRARVQIDFKWGFIDETGKVVIPPQFETAQNFSEGLACVWTGGKSGFVNHAEDHLL